MKKYQIINLKTYPENNNDASSKKYVDESDAKLLDLAGNRAMTGDLDMSDNSIVAIRDINASNSVVSKKYVDDQDAKSLPLAGGTMTGSLDMNLNAIVSLKAPIGDSNAATKKYVDDYSYSKSYIDVNYLLRARTIDMANQLIINLGDPLSVHNAATKRYVDSQPKIFNYLFSFDAHAAHMVISISNPLTTSPMVVL